MNLQTLGVVASLVVYSILCYFLGYYDGQRAGQKTGFQHGVDLAKHYYDIVIQHVKSS